MQPSPARAPASVMTNASPLYQPRRRSRASSKPSRNRTPSGLSSDRADAVPSGATTRIVAVMSPNAVEVAVGRLVASMDTPLRYQSPLNLALVDRGIGPGGDPSRPFQGEPVRLDRPPDLL